MEFRTLNRPNCPLCGSPEAMPLFDVWDDRFGQPDVYPLRECRTCHFAFLGTVVHPDEAGRLYAKYYARPGASELPPAGAARGRLAIWGRWLDGNVNPAYTVRSGEKVLDIGCGTGATLLIGRELGADMEGLEVDPVAADMAAALGFSCHKGMLADCPTLAGRRYDRIILNQVLEHVEQPVKELRHCREILRDGGKVVVAAPCLDGFLRRVCGARWISWHAPYHMNHFSRRALAVAAEQAGLKMASFKIRTPGSWILAQIAMGKAERGTKNSCFRTKFALWQRALVAPVGRLTDLLRCGEAFLAILTPERGGG